MCLLQGGEANILDGLAGGRGLGWSGADLQEAVMLLSSLHTAVNMSLIPQAGLSTADNLSGEEFHLWWSPQGSHRKFLLDGIQFYLGKGGGWTMGGVKWGGFWCFFFFLWYEAKLKLTHNFWVLFLPSTTTSWRELSCFHQASDLSCYRKVHFLTEEQQDWTHENPSAKVFPK